MGVTVRWEGNTYTRGENGVWVNGAGVELNPNLDFIPRLEELASAVEASDGVEEPAVEETVEPLEVEVVEEATSAVE